MPRIVRASDPITVTTNNVNALTLHFGAGDAMFDNKRSVKLEIDDGQAQTVRR